MRYAALVLVCALFGAGSSLGAPQAAPSKRSGCPERFPLGGEGSELKVHNMTCRKARRIVLIFYGVSQEEGPHATVRGFDCDAKATGGFSVVKCRRRDERLRYRGGFYKRAAEKPKVGCWNRTWPNEQGTSHPQFYVAPRKCAILRRGTIAIAGGDAIARKLKWRWGNRTARARGQIYISSAGFHPGRLKLTKPVVSSGRLVYSKVLARINPDYGDAYHYSFRIYTC